MKSMTLAAIFLLAALATPAAAQTNCSVSPDTLSLSQGSTGSVRVKLNLVDATPYELSLGNFPTSVEGGLDKSVYGDITLWVQAKADAQTGSFMVPLLYKLASSGAEAQLICQLNLVIKSNPNAKLIQPAAAPKTKTISEGVLPRAFVSTASSTPGAAGKQLITMKLVRGSRGVQVTALQEILKTLKFFPIQIESSGYFGEVTETSVRAFQIMNNLEPVGYVGPRTRALLNNLNQ
jgi:hypothetical protein